MRHDVRMKRWEDSSPRRAGRAITASLPGKPAFSLGLIGLTIWVFLSLCGCSGTGRTVILQPPEANVRYSSVLVLEEDSGTFVPAQVSRDFRTALMTYLYDRGPFVHGPELRIVYRITGVHPAGREKPSGGKEEPGTGSVTAEVAFVNFAGKEIASIHAQGESGNSGPVDKAVKECAWQVASYAKRNFWEVGKGSGGERVTREEKHRSMWKPANGGAQ